MVFPIGGSFSDCLGARCLLGWMDAHYALAVLYAAHGGAIRRRHPVDAAYGKSTNRSHRHATRCGVPRCRRHRGMGFGRCGHRGWCVFKPTADPAVLGITPRDSRHRRLLRLVQCSRRLTGTSDQRATGDRGLHSAHAHCPCWRSFGRVAGRMAMAFPDAQSAAGHRASLASR
jgi:hypothetical protein